MGETERRIQMDEKGSDGERKKIYMQDKTSKEE